MPRESLMQHNKTVTAALIERCKAADEACKKIDATPFGERKDKRNMWHHLEKKCGLNLDWCYNSPEFVLWVTANWEYIRDMEEVKEEEL